MGSLPGMIILSTTILYEGKEDEAFRFSSPSRIMNPTPVTKKTESIRDSEGIFRDI
jgi:hypothetical protein